MALDGWGIGEGLWRWGMGEAALNSLKDSP